MGLLKSLTGGDVLSAGSGLLGGIIGGISANRAAKKQYEYQRKLNEQSQEFSEKNATTAYERQRELTQDNPLLQLQGMRNAGLSTSFSEGSSVAGAANVDQGATPAPGAAPSVASLAQGFNQGSEMGAIVSDLLLKSSQRRQIDAVADNQEIKNDFEFQQQMADLRVKKANARNAEEKAVYQRMENDLMSKYGERLRAAQTGAAESDEAKKAEEASIMGIIRRYKDQQEVADLANKRQQLKVMLEDEKLKRKEREHIVAMIREIDQNILESAARIENLDANTEGVEINNEVGKATKDDKIAILKSQRVKAWYDAQPKNLQQVIMSSEPVRKAISNAQNGNLSKSDVGALIAVFGYEKGGEIVKQLIDLFPAKKAANLAKTGFTLVRRALRKKPGKHRVPVWKQYQ